MKGEINDENMGLCEELFQLVLEGTEGMSQLFSYTVWCDVGGGEHELDPNDPTVWYEMNIFEQTHEHVGGSHDGSVGYFGFHTDLGRLIAAMMPREGDDVVSVEFGATLHLPEDPCVIVDGTYKGRKITVKLNAYPPDGDKAVGPMKVYENGSFSYGDSDE